MLSIHRIMKPVLASSLGGKGGIVYEVASEASEAREGVALT